MAVPGGETRALWGWHGSWERLKLSCLPSNPVFTLSSKAGGSHGKGCRIMGNLSVLMLCVCYFLIHLLLYLIGGADIPFAMQNDWAVHMSVEENGSEHELIFKAVHAWNNLFYNSGGKPAYASVRCSKPVVIEEIKYSCDCMFINMNLGPNGFWWVSVFAEPPESLNFLEASCKNLILPS